MEIRVRGTYGAESPMSATVVGTMCVCLSPHPHITLKSQEGHVHSRMGSNHRSVFFITDVSNFTEKNVNAMAGQRLSQFPSDCKKLFFLQQVWKMWRIKNKSPMIPQTKEDDNKHFSLFPTYLYIFVTRAHTLRHLTSDFCSILLD